MKLGVGVSPTTSIVASQTAAVISASASPTIESIRESRVFTWTAGLSTTSQTVINRESSPADGSSQTTYDVRQGTSTGSDSRDPTYGSTLKNYRQSSTSSLDFLTMEGFKTTTTFTNSLHKAGAEFTVELGVNFQTAPGVVGVIASTAEDTDDTGVSFRQTSANKFDVFFHKGTSGTFLFTRSGDTALSTGVHHLVFSAKADDTSFATADGSYYTFNSGGNTFTLDFTSQTPSTGSSTHNWHFLTSLLNADLNNPRFQMGNNSGLGYFAVYNKAVSKAEADILYANAPAPYDGS